MKIPQANQAVFTILLHAQRQNLVTQVISNKTIDNIYFLVYTKNVKFEWDTDKNKANKAKHGLSFEEALEVFADPNLLEIYDKDHSGDEERYKVIGLLSSKLIIISVIFTERGQVIRIISARKANKEEKGIYEQKR